MTGIPLIIAFFIMVVVMIVAISKFKIHPFLSIMGVSLILALLALPLAKVPGTIGAGFSGTFSSLGIVIILGAMIGGFVFGFFGTTGVTGFNLWSIFVASVGAVILLVIINLFTK